MQIKIPPNYGKKYIEAFENIYSEVASETDAKLISFMLENVALSDDLMQPDGIGSAFDFEKIKYSRIQLILLKIHFFI